MTKDEVLALSLTKAERAQAERTFQAFQRLGKPLVIKGDTETQVKAYLTKKVAEYEKKQQKKAEKNQKTANDIRSLAKDLCKGKNKKLTFDELYAIMEDAAIAKKRKELDAKIAKQQAELAAMQAERAELD